MWSGTNCATAPHSLAESVGGEMVQMSHVPILKRLVWILGPVAAVVWVIVLLGFIFPPKDGSAASGPNTRDTAQLEVEVMPPVIFRPGQEPEGMDPEAEEPGDSASPLPLELADVYGMWEFTFTREYSLPGSGELIATETVLGTMEVLGTQHGDSVEVFILPTSYTVDETPNLEILPSEPNLTTGYFQEGTLYLYLGMDDFFVDPDLEVPDPVEPDYFPIRMQQTRSGPVGVGHVEGTSEVGGTDLTIISRMELRRG